MKPTLLRIMQRDEKGITFLNMNEDNSESISSEYILNVTGSFISNELNFIEQCEKEKLELQDRIDKAIKFIEDACYVGTEKLPNGLGSKNTEKLYKILKGNNEKKRA